MLVSITPGPWVMSSGMVETAAGVPIARMDREYGNGTQPVERDNNCRLIAAAPELLKSLTELCNLAPRATRDTVKAGIYAEAWAAIRKATRG